MNTKRVLLVDDDDDVADLVTELVQSAGYAVTRVNCGDDAVRLLEVGHCGVGLIITDLQMPNGNGLKVKKFADSLHIKVLILSAQAAAYAPVMQTAAFMAKPWNNDSLIQVVRTAMSQWHEPITGTKVA
jgi:DNA-binding NtrC family response regulator